MAAPSPRTKPSRSTSQGRDARSGSSLRRLMACIWAKQAIGSGWMTPSVPPTTTTSARPSRIMSMPSAIDSLLEAQAETGVCTPAWAPEPEADVGGGGVGHQHRDGQRADAAGALLLLDVPVAEQRLQTADAGGDRHAEPFAIDRVVLLQAEAGVAPGLQGGDDAELGRAVQPAGLDPLQHLGRIDGGARRRSVRPGRRPSPARSCSHRSGRRAGPPRCWPRHRRAEWWRRGR